MFTMVKDSSPVAAKMSLVGGIASHTQLITESVLRYIYQISILANFHRMFFCGFCKLADVC